MLQRKATPSIPKHLQPKNIQFTVLTNEEIRKLSVLKVTTPLSFNNFGHALVGGIYDPRLGPVADGVCGTCSNNAHQCPGHFGHIELPFPVVNPLFHKAVCHLLKLSCLHCHKLQLDVNVKLQLEAKYKLLQEGYFNELCDLQQEIELGDKNVGTSDRLVKEEYLKNVIKQHIETIKNRDRFKERRKEEASINTKSANMQWQLYIEDYLKSKTVSGKAKVCVHCGEIISAMKVTKDKIIIMTKKQSEGENESIIRRMEKQMIMPKQAKEHLRALWMNESNVMKIMYPCLSTVTSEHPTDVFFFDIVPVLPPLVRPASYVNNELIENPQSQAYKAILHDCLIIRNIVQAIKDKGTNNLPKEAQLLVEMVRGKDLTEKLHGYLEKLQVDVDHLMDRELNRNADSNNILGLKQIIEKKEGIIRMHMMGKRVNYAARSVITPDPNLNVDEIGVPEAFALKLTYAVPVTPFNVTKLRKMVMNGPQVHPGAVSLEDEDGRITRLSSSDHVQRESIAKGLLTTSKADKFFPGVKIVHRHLINGDIMLLNRQPTLHKPSIMAHKARILKDEKTLRLHYANCKHYNSDFDGDEMNAHFLQHEYARSEGHFITNVCNQYLVPKDGSPLSGLIQDHVVGGVKMTMRGKFFNKTDYMNLVWAALHIVPGNIKILPPAIIKPETLWSGKQIISTVLINIIPNGKPLINLKSTSKINVREWQTEEARPWKYGGSPFTDPKTMSEAEVIFRQGEHLSGVLDKAHYGATSFSLVHCVYQLYGGECSSKLLSAFGKLFQAFLQREGFSLGISDILVIKKNDEKRKKIVKELRQIGPQIHRSVLQVNENTSDEEVRKKMHENYLTNPKFRTQVDREYKAALDVFTNEINKTCLPAGLLKKFPHNNLQMMIQSGAKGSAVNAMQISCLLGQVELEGKRPPLMINGKSLPCFLPYEPSPMAGGYVDGRFLTGIKPQEFFFHCMAGREGLIDTAVKTSRSGYLQRCLIKHLEGVIVNYDMTVRDSDGSLIQTAYGEDGLDIPGSRFLCKEQMEFLVENRHAIVDNKLVECLKAETNIQIINKQNRKISKWKKRFGDPLKKRHISGFAKFSTDMPVKDSAKYKKMLPCGRTEGAIRLMRKWVRASDEIKEKYVEEVTKCPEPVITRHRPDMEFGVLPEAVDSLIAEYYKQNHSPTAMIEKSELKDLLCVEVQKTICPPGEPVGILAAQSIGEPSTQMTLNTFHFAGRGDMNVTLGIPRLREILMMASKNIKTPYMEIPFKKNLKNAKRVVETMCLKLTRCTLADVLTTIRCDQDLVLLPERRLEFVMRMEFLPHKHYKRKYYVKPATVLKRVEEVFFVKLFKAIDRFSNSKTKATLVDFEKDSKAKVDCSDAQLDYYQDDAAEESKKQSKLELGELHESSDEEEAAEDADATTARILSRHQENQEYDDPEEEEQLADPDNEDKDSNDDLEEEKNPEDDQNDMNRPLDEQDDDRISAVLFNQRVISYEYDSENNLWCTLKFWLPLSLHQVPLPQILRKVAESIVLWEVPGIKRAFSFENQNKEIILKTDGINIGEISKHHETLDISRIYSNDIYRISEIYGIEAANRLIIKEVKDVFNMYGIKVDYRHLSLIADYMTFDGLYKPLNRKGMENSASPLQQMSFESSLAFLKNATSRAKTDDLTSPSARIMVGLPIRCGTGMIDTFTDLTKYIK